MHGILKISILIALIALTALLSSRCPFNDVKDSCLDRGGAWNEALLRCDGIDGNHPGDCFRIYPCVITGKYVTYSESEGQISIMIYPEEMGAKVNVERWKPGKYDERESDWSYLSWACEDKTLHIEQKNGTTTILHYNSALSLEPLGRAGTAPGLEFVSSSIPDDVLKGLVFWREEYL